MKMLCIANSLAIFLTLLTEGSSQDCPANEVLRFPLYDCRWCREPANPCYLVFQRGCECMPGFARNDFGLCIELYLCPREPPGDTTENSSEEMSSTSSIGTSSEEMSSTSSKGTSSEEMSSTSSKGTSSQEMSSTSHEGSSSSSEGGQPPEISTVSSSSEEIMTTNEQDSSTTNPCPPNEDLTFPVNECNRCTASSTCNLVWVRACDCKPGYARDDSGFCIPIFLCPSPSSSTGGASTDGTTSSSESTMSSSESTWSSSESTWSSSESTISPSESTMISSESTMSSSESTWSSSESTWSSSESTWSPSESPMSSSESTWSSSESTISPSESTMSSSESTLSSNEGTTNGEVRSTTEICPRNEEITYPINECNNCRPSQTCSIVWVSGCDCKEDYKRDEFGVCIPAFLCPNQPPVISTEGSTSEETSVTEESTSSTEGSTSSTVDYTSNPQESTSVSEETTKPPIETSIITEIVTRILTEVVTVLPE